MIPRPVESVTFKIRVRLHKEKQRNSSQMLNKTLQKLSWEKTLETNRRPRPAALPCSGTDFGAPGRRLARM